MVEGVMDSEARERLIRLETLQAETNRRMDALIALAETMARMQEREHARDARIDAIYTNISAQSTEIDKLKKMKFWLAGVLAVITFAGVPSAAWVLKDTYTLITTLDRRQVRMETIIGLDHKTR